MKKNKYKGDMKGRDLISMLKLMKSKGKYITLSVCTETQTRVSRKTPCNGSRIG